jgi:hypothetical protein
MTNTPQCLVEVEVAQGVKSRGLPGRVWINKVEIPNVHSVEAEYRASDVRKVTITLLATAFVELAIGFDEEAET